MFIFASRSNPGFDSPSDELVRALAFFCSRLFWIWFTRILVWNFLEYQNELDLHRVLLTLLTRCIHAFVVR